MRRTKEELQKARREANIKKMLAVNKFFRDSKYYKNNYWGMAAWDSWAAQGKVGGCATCHERHYNGTLHNKRAANKFCNEVSRHFCSLCIREIENQLNHKFETH